MAATTIFFNGRLISVPDAYTEVDASGLESVGLSASGIVACLGTSEGGKPWSEVSEADVRGTLQVSTNPNQPFSYFRSGDLKEAAPLLFGPSNDEDVQGGAQEILHVKVNPAAQSSATFADAVSNVMTATSRDWGYFTTQINIEIGTGTNQGKMITVVFEDTEEIFDDVGGDDLFTVQYLSGTPADGFTTITLEVSPSALLAAFTRDQTGLDGDVTNQVTATQVIECVSDSASDVGVIIEIYGTDTSDVAQTAQVTLAGLTAVDTTETWNSFHGARVISGTLVGTCTLQNDGGGTAICTLTAGAPTAGLEPLVDCPAGVSSIRKIILDSTTDFVAGDVGKTITADGVDIGPLVDYSNDDPIANSGIAWVRDTNDHGAVADNQVIACPLGTGGGDANGASTVAGWLDYVADGASTARVSVIGLDASGSQQQETVQLDGTNPIVGALGWSRIDYLALGELAAAVTLTVGGNAINAPYSGIDTLQKQADLFNGKPGFTFTLLTGTTSLDPTNLDYVSAVDCKSPAEPGFESNLYDIIAKLNSASSLVTAARVAGGAGAPSNTTAPVYLSGGHEGSSTPGQEAIPTAANSDWQSAIDLLTKVHCNQVVAITADPAIHAMLKAHVRYMGGAGRNERDAKVGLMNADQSDLATKAQIKSQIVDLNNKYVSAWAQNVERYNTSGDAEVMDPTFGACILAGMEAGSPVGQPTTKHFIDSLSLEQDSTWNPVDDADEMIQAGLCFAETVDGRGRRIVRGVTTHLTSSNIAYTEQSVVHATNYAVYNYRTEMETVVGRAGFSGTATAAQAQAVGVLGKLIDVAIVAYRSLSTSLTLDVIEQTLEMAPVLPVNFVKSTIHLVAVPQSAAAA